MDRGTVIEAEVNELCGVVNAQHARLVDLVVELSADRRLWQGDGVWTMGSWLGWRCGVSASTARHIVAIAERVDDLPISTAVFREGRLSLEQMAAVARRAPWWTDEQMSRLAAKLTVSQLRRMLGAYPFPHFDDDGNEIRHPAPGTVDADADDGSGNASAAAAAHAVGYDSPAPSDDPSGVSVTRGNDVADLPQAVGPEEWLSMRYDDHGGFRLDLITDTATGSVIESALIEARDRLFRASRPDVSWVDALRELAETSLDGVEPTRRHRFRTNVHLNVDGVLTDAQRRRLPDTMAEMITCDGVISPVLIAEARPLSVGRSRRVVPDRTRTVVEHRDAGRCRVPGCHNERWLEIHHIIHWSRNGPTDTWNLVTLCAHHHRRHHRGLLGITGNADLDTDTPGGLEFTDRRGRPISASGAQPTPIAGAPPPPSGVFAHPLGERLESRWLYFNPPDVTGVARPRPTPARNDELGPPSQPVREPLGAGEPAAGVDTGPDPPDAECRHAATDELPAATRATAAPAAMPRTSDAA